MLTQLRLLVLVLIERRSVGKPYINKTSCRVREGVGLVQPQNLIKHEQPFAMDTCP